MAQSRSQYIKAKVNTSHHMKKVSEIRDAVKKNRKTLAVKEQELEEARQEVAEVERTWKRYEKQSKEGVAKRRDIRLDEEQVMSPMIYAACQVKLMLDIFFFNYFFYSSKKYFSYY